MKQILKHKINYKQVSKGLGISEDLVVKFFNDGRIIGRLGEFILEDKDVGKRSDNEGTSYDNVTDDNKHLEVRSITNRLSFAPSKETGYGRTVTEEGFSEKLNVVDSFIAIDFKDNPSELDFYKIPSVDVKRWSDEGFIGKGKAVSRNKILSKINESI
tara:strand:+ start:149 stop:622 length:474 start_codon:yes stop_codon:yes gene_type:complete